jgi:hypothetical protein
MTCHGENKTLPPFKIKTIRQYRDCLSRQVGEAIAILLSKDNLLNSKNEYIQNCISRITVQEDMVERKRRIQKEDEEDRMEEERIKAFKSQKRPTKRKQHQIPEGRKEAKRRKVNQELVVPQLNTGKDPHHEQVVGGMEKLRILRERMRMEKERIIEYMDKKTG